MFKGILFHTNSVEQWLSNILPLCVGFHVCVRGWTWMISKSHYAYTVKYWLGHCLSHIQCRVMIITSIAFKNVFLKESMNKVCNNKYKTRFSLWYMCDCQALSLVFWGFRIGCFGVCWEKGQNEVSSYVPLSSEELTSSSKIKGMFINIVP